MNNSQSGAVSLFVVIFTALLLTIITISFVQLMVRDQRQATASDLSQSAYDSAQAGVEDAKRLLLLNQACQNGTAAPGVNCALVTAALAPDSGGLQSACDTLAKSGLVSETNGETLIQQTTGDNAAKLDQAYTCVKVATDTADYLGQLENDESTVIPIKGDKPFSQIELSWFSAQDLASTSNLGLSYASTGSETVLNLPRVGAKWPANNPALMRIQLMQFGGNFTLSDFDNSADASTLFLYPLKLSSADNTTMSFALDARRSPVNAPQVVDCRDSLVTGGYACKAIIQLPNPANGSAANRTAYLRLSAIYNKAHFQIKLLDSAGGDVKLSGVQPEVDSTGRANDLFRRVVARVELRGDAVYPNAEIDLLGNLCKNFTVTGTAAGYTSSPTCTP
jgi:Tfp pilus assembly protein PilX